MALGQPIHRLGQDPGAVVQHGLQRLWLKAIAALQHTHHIRHLANPRRSQDLGSRAQLGKEIV